MATDPFRFDTLLKIRENLRNDRRRELSAAERAQEEAAERLAETERLLAANLDRWRQALAAPNAERISRFREHQNRLLERQTAERNELADLNARTEERRALFDEAVRDVRILENLRRKKEEIQAESARKAEQKGNDERR